VGPLARRAENLGFDLLGLGDSQSLFRDVYVGLTIAALHTARIRLGPTVTNPRTRHAAVTANAIASLDEVSGGRAFLGLGSGDSAVYTLGLPPARLGDLEDALRTLGALTAGEAVTRDGRRLAVRGARHRVPLYLAAEGPRTLGLAGRLADGVIVGTGVTPEAVAPSLAALRAGAEEVGRDPAAIDVWWLVKACIADSREQAVGEIKMALAASANHAFRFTLEGKAVPPDLAEPIRRLQGEYNAHEHEVLGPTGNAALTDRLGLTGYLAERFAIAGTPAECAAQVERAVAAGARQLLLTGIVRDPTRFVERWAGEVVPRLTRASA
jgi:5,10-methylenetetrahydromethanopterin reductase